MPSDSEHYNIDHRPSPPPEPPKSPTYEHIVKVLNSPGLSVGGVNVSGNPGIGGSISITVTKPNN